MQKKGKINDNQRAAKLCEITLTDKIDFGYKVRVEKLEDIGSTLLYTMQVLQVIKEGSDKVTEGHNRTFLSFPHCRETLGLATGKTFLIMGTSKDMYRDEERKSYQYVLGERTWIEYWPTNAECQTEKHRPTCLGLEQMADQYEVFGCQQ